MKWKLLTFKVVAIISAILSGVLGATATEAPDSSANPRYEKRLERRSKSWGKLIPNLFTLQYAGGTGMVSIGPGWDYGRNNSWETHFLVGFVPRRYHGGSSYWTITFKETFLPWTLCKGKTVDIKPLSVSLGINSILHGDFWASEPDRYPKGYYGFSSRVRFHLGIGQRVSLNIPWHRRHLGRQLSIYYELSTCDLYVRQKILNHSIPFKDILTLGIGIIYTI